MTAVERPLDSELQPAAVATILLLSVDEASDLARSLPAARAQPGAHVLVVDNASADATARLAAEHGADLLRLPERLSYAAAINRGLGACTQATAVLLLNADCVLSDGFLAAARSRLDAPGVGSVAPLLVRERDGAVDAAGMRITRQRRNGLVGHGAPATDYGTPATCFGPDGACALYRRETLDACALPAAPGGSSAPEILDEDMALWATDADLAWRARLLGWECAYEPAAVARHRRTYSPSTRATVAAHHRRLQFRNRYLMWVKNETRAGLLRDAPQIIAFELAALGYVLLRERELLRGYRDAWDARAGARRRRAAVQARRRLDRVPFGLEPPR